MERHEEKEGWVDYFVSLWRRKARGDGKIIFDLCGFTPCDFFFEHDYQLLNKSRNTCIVKYLYNEFLGNWDFFLIH